jgi:hypothetical protein
MIVFGFGFVSRLHQCFTSGVARVSANSLAKSAWRKSARFDRMSAEFKHQLG